MAFALSAEISKASDKRKALQKSQYDKLDEILYDWFMLKREGVPISGPVLMEKENNFSQKWILQRNANFQMGGFHVFKKVTE